MTCDVVVLGAGYAGAHAAHRAARAGADVTVVDPTACHGFAPRWAAIAGGRVPAGDVAAPLTSVVEGVRVVPDRAVAVDVDGQRVDLAGGGTLRYDALVVTTGARAATPDLPGLADHAWTLDGPEATLALREVLAADDRPLVVVGGGATGVQLATETAQAHPGRVVHLVEAGPALLPEEPARLRRAAGRQLARVGVAVTLGVAVARTEATGVVLADGSHREGHVVWAGGWTTTGHDLLPDAATEDGRLLVDLDLAVPGHPHVYAAGDVAAHRDVFARPLPMSAQIAAQAGKVAGRNAALVPAGSPPAPAVLLEAGRVLDLGGVGLARVGPVRLTGRPLDRVVPLLHQAIDLRHLWQLGGPRAVYRHAPGRNPVAPLAAVPSDAGDDERTAEVA